MPNIVVAIGGGNLQLKETLEIDQKILELTGKSKPRVLFLPTASRDDQGYAKRFKKYYRELGCEADALRLLHTKKTREEIAEQIFRYDIIYLGGGDTRFLMEILQQLQLDLILRKAYESGILLAGYSAGANVLFQYGYSDIDDRLQIIEGLGIVPGIFTPHAQQRLTFQVAAAGYEEPRIACADGQAYILIDGKGSYFPGNV